MQNASQQIECVIPVVPVSDIARSVNFYLETLGFKLDWGGEAGSCIGSVSRDGHCLMLMKRDPIAEPAWIWIGVEDESLFDIYRSRGVKVRQEPKNFSWAYEMKFEDPDGNVLWLGTEPRKDLPLEDR
jgi:predicted lactoylglutathione lyase